MPQSVNSQPKTSVSQDLLLDLGEYMTNQKNGKPFLAALAIHLNDKSDDDNLFGLVANNLQVEKGELKKALTSIGLIKTELYAFITKKPD